MTSAVLCGVVFFRIMVLTHFDRADGVLDTLLDVWWVFVRTVRCHWPVSLHANRHVYHSINIAIFLMIASFSTSTVFTTR